MNFPDPHPESEQEITAFRQGFDDGYSYKPYKNPYRELLWRKYDAGFLWAMKVREKYNG